jgi:cytochrome c oxidase cbb3-type subunit 3
VKRVTLFVLAGALACAGPTGTAQAPPPESPAARYLKDPEAVDRGRRIFIGTCGAYCHSTHDVERDAPSLFDCEWKHGGTDEQIFKSIAEGIPNTRMPAWKGALPQGDDDIWRVVAYLRAASTCATH